MEVRHNPLMQTGQRGLVYPCELSSLRAQATFDLGLKVLQRLKAHGHKAVFAGGCVRDGLMGIAPKDLDIATSAPPEEVEKIFTHTLPVGREFGTMVVVEEGHSFEVTTFRQDGPYLDGRHPSKVTFAAMEEDARRRDFTVNALFFDPVAGQVLDYVDGIADLSRRVLRTVGDARARFDEDHLRPLRAVRFVGQLGFSLDAVALAAIQERPGYLRDVSAERIFAEMKRLLGSAHLAGALEVLLQSQLYVDFWPEVAAVPLRGRGDGHRRNYLGWENAFAGLMFEAGVENAAAVARLRSWKAPGDSFHRVHVQLRGVRALQNNSLKRAERLKIVGGECGTEVLQLVSVCGAAFTEEELVKELLSVVDSSGNLPRAFLNGQDLIAEGIVPGPMMGHYLEKLYEAQLEGQVRDRAGALNFLKNLRA